MADFLDMVGQYARNRMDQATMPFTDPEGYARERFNNAFPTAETEEERRKRLEREAAQRGNTEVQSTQVKTYADGSQEEIIKKQLPPEAAPTAPVAPPEAPAQQAPAQQAPVQQAVAAPQAPVQQAPAQPVAPSTFDRMVQAESGGRQFAPNGQILTSPKGALGLAQILPSTAKNPGYGIEPATPEEIATPEGNRAFGERYYQGLLKHFEGDERKAIAAYNAGPGRVQKNIEANQGQLNVAQLPTETQNYLQKVQGPVAPQQAQTQPMIAGTASSDVALTPTEQAIQQQRKIWNNDFEKAQNDTTSLYAIAGNKEKYPDEVRQLAKDRARQLELDEQKKLNAEKTAISAATGDKKATNDLMRAITTKSEEGSYIKAYLFSRLGLNELARSEQEKLASPSFTQAIVDGESYMLEVKGGGVVGAFDKKGTRITDDAKLAQINTNYINLAKGSSAGSTTFTDPVTKQTLTKVDTLKGPIYYDKAGSRVIPKGEPIPNTVSGNVDLQNQLQLQSIRNKLTGLKGEERIKTLEAENRIRMAEGKPLWDLNAVGLSPQGDWLVSPTGAAPGGETTGSVARTAKGEGARVEESSKVTGKAEGEVGAKDIKNQAFADSSYSLIKPISDAIKQSTGSAIGTGVDKLAGAIGKSTTGAEAIAQLDVLGYSLVSNVPRFEGPQGVRDVELYERAAGDLANSSKPVKVRLAALDAIILLMKKYDKKGTNDWSFSTEEKKPTDEGSPQDKARAEIERRKKEKK